MGGLSGALNDCIAAGLPSISNEHLAEAMLAPSFVRRVPDNISSVLVAEAVLDILNSGENNARPFEAANEFRSRHSPEVYCSTLVKNLGLDISVVRAP